MKTWQKSILQTFEIASDRGLVLQVFDAAVNLAPIVVLCIFGSQYIMRRVLNCSVILRSNLVLLISSLDFVVCEYLEDIDFYLEKLPLIVFKCSIFYI